MNEQVITSDTGPWYFVVSSESLRTVDPVQLVNLLGLDRAIPDIFDGYGWRIFKSERRPRMHAWRSAGVAILAMTRTRRDAIRCANAPRKRGGQ